jgi:CRISPR-associated protein Csx10
MTTLNFTARLLSDAVISERAATTGGHNSLDYIPGATLLGAVAAQLYNRDHAAAFQLFHSGKVRFGNAYPLSSANQPTIPVPLCWHLPKGAEAPDFRKIHNLIHATEKQFEEWDNRGEQQKQLRSGYLSPTGEKVAPAKNYRLKTALDRSNMGLAKEAHLFGYQSLASGSCWYFSIDFDDSLEPSLVTQVADALNGTIRVGRSRSAEYGILAVNRIETAPMQMQPVAGEQLTLYCLSDLALSDIQTGTPTFIPDPAGHLGLSDSSFSPGRSYIRIRSYAPFNTTRKCFDIERQVIAKGSVLVFTRTGGYSLHELQQLQQRLAAGIGSHRQDGLGRILVNPQFLAGFGFQPFEAQTIASPPSPASEPLPPVAAWLGSRSAERAEEAETIRQVDGWIRELIKGQCPKNSQWGQLRNIAVQLKELAEIKQRIEKLCSDGVSQKQWEKPVTISGSRTKYRQFIQETVLANDATLAQVRKRLYLLGNRLPRLRDQNENGGDQ